MRYEIVDTPFGSQLTRFNDDGSISHIPQSEDNADYQRYLRHLAGEDESGTLS